MCEFNEYGRVIEHANVEYTCPECGADLCSDCNPLDQRGSWHGGSWCCVCDATIEEADFTQINLTGTGEEYVYRKV